MNYTYDITNLYSILGNYLDCYKKLDISFKSYINLYIENTDKEILKKIREEELNINSLNKMIAKHDLDLKEYLLKFQSFYTKEILRQENNPFNSKMNITNLFICMDKHNIKYDNILKNKIIECNLNIKLYFNMVSDKLGVVSSILSDKIAFFSQIIGYSSPNLYEVSQSNSIDIKDKQSAKPIFLNTLV